LQIRYHGWLIKLQRSSVLNPINLQGTMIMKKSSFIIGILFPVFILVQMAMGNGQVAIVLQQDDKSTTAANSLGVSHKQVLSESEEVLGDLGVTANFEKQKAKSEKQRSVLEKNTGVTISSLGPEENVQMISLEASFDDFMSQTEEGAQTREHFHSLMERVVKKVDPSADVDFVKIVQDISVRGASEVNVGDEHVANLALIQTPLGKRIVAFKIANKQFRADK
jgi:hypothetical protein